MHGSVHGCIAWCTGIWVDGVYDDVVGLGKMHLYTTWIGEVGLGHWGRFGLSGDVAVE